MGIAQYENAATPLRTRGIDITNQHFQMRYITVIYLKVLKIYWASNVEGDHVGQKVNPGCLWKPLTLQPFDLQELKIPLLKALSQFLNISDDQKYDSIFKV